MKTMKKAKILLAILLSVLFVIFALGSGGKTTSSNIDNEEENFHEFEEGVPEETETESESPEPMVTIDMCEVKSSEYGETSYYVVVDYTFTNTSDEITTFDNEYKVIVSQEGCILSEVLIVFDTGESFQEGSRQIKPGASLKVQNAYWLLNIESDVEVEVIQLSSNETVALKTFILVA